jgi:hypothetical protein
MTLKEEHCLKSEAFPPSATGENIGENRARLSAVFLTPA